MGILDNMFGGKPKLEKEDNPFENGLQEDVNLNERNSDAEENNLSENGEDFATDNFPEDYKEGMEKVSDHIKADTENLKKISSLGKE